jgi:hypothetical protein
MNTILTTGHDTPFVSILSIRDQWVQDFLWHYVVPEDIRFDYTKLDAIKFIESQVYSGDQVLVGNGDVIMRCVVHNQYVVEPHILGNGKHFRSVMEASIELARQQTDLKQVVVWTSHKAIGRILNKCNFKLTGTVPNYHLTSDGLKDVMHYTREI